MEDVVYEYYKFLHRTLDWRAMNIGADVDYYFIQVKFEIELMAEKRETLTTILLDVIGKKQ